MKYFKAFLAFTLFAFVGIQSAHACDYDIHYSRDAILGKNPPVMLVEILGNGREYAPAEVINSTINFDDYAVLFNDYWSCEWDSSIPYL